MISSISPNFQWFAPVPPKGLSLPDAGITNDGKLELSLMHFHHTNPKWQMPKECEAYLEKIQEQGTYFNSDKHDQLSNKQL